MLLTACACVSRLDPALPSSPLPKKHARDHHNRTRDEVAQAVAAVSKKMPKRIKRKRPITTTDGTPLGGMEEYYDYVFPEEAGVAPNLKLLEAAMRWKRQKLNADANSGAAAQPQEQQPAAAEEEQGQEEEEEMQDGDDDGY